MDDELEEVLSRLSSSKDIDDQSKAESMRYWNERVKEDGSELNRRMRRLVYEHQYES